MEIRDVEGIIEGVLFAAGDPVSLEKLSGILEIEKKALKLILNNMVLNYQNSKRGLLIREIDGAYQLCTKTEHYEYIKKLIEPRQKQVLSQAAYETLAIIAYNQPVTRLKIEQIRGVSSESSITRLVERNLVREAGRMDSPGKPFLYETTEEFLRSFGFKALSDLPILEFNELQSMEEIEIQSTDS